MPCSSSISAGRASRVRMIAVPRRAYEDARVDDILARLHDTSLNDLSREEL